jgi:hypothetical protein
MIALASEALSGAEKLIIKALLSHLRLLRLQQMTRSLFKIAFLAAALVSIGGWIWLLGWD